MAWTSPLTATLNGTLTAAQWNSNIRDNLNGTEAALAPSADIDSDGQASYYFVSTAANAIAPRRSYSKTVILAQDETTTSSSYTNLATFGPSVPCKTGTAALVFITAMIGNSTAGAYAAASFAVSGATTQSASDTFAIESEGIAAATTSDQMVRRSSMQYVSGLTAGVNTFTMVYRQSGGTGRFRMRHIVVFPL